MIFKNSNISKDESAMALVNKIKDDIFNLGDKLNISNIDVADMITNYVYNKHKNLKKTLLWDMFGEYIIDNINKNLTLSLKDNNVKMCYECGKRFKRNSTVQVYCDKCAKKIDRQKANERMKMRRIK